MYLVGTCIKVCREADIDYRFFCITLSPVLVCPEVEDYNSLHPTEEPLVNPSYVLIDVIFCSLHGIVCSVGVIRPRPQG